MIIEIIQNEGVMCAGKLSILACLLLSNGRY